MTKRLLIDATHELETRVAIIVDEIIEHYDFVSSAKRQLKGNIYLGKITRIEPSLQAAFVEYGGNKQGFLSFSEIHPDYYQIPIADRQRLMEEAARLAEEEAARAERAERDEEGEDSEGYSLDENASSAEDRPRRGRRRRGRGGRQANIAATAQETLTDAAAIGDAPMPSTDFAEAALAEPDDVLPADAPLEAATEAGAEPQDDAPKTKGRRRPFAKKKAQQARTPSMETSSEPVEEGDLEPESQAQDAEPFGQMTHNSSAEDFSLSLDESDDERDESDDSEHVETVSEEDVVKPRPFTIRRYKIQEVIKPNQIVLVQVIKEERGNKGCSLSTYISLPGRYCVLMPNSPKDGGISRKIGTGTDRKRLKEIAAELKESRGMSAIIRTAGIDRSRTEIKRDYEYLIKLWSQTRDLALSSTAPALVYEEGDIVKRTVRDYYNSDIAEVLVQGEAAYKSAKEFMKMIMPSHAARVKHFKERQPLFSAYGVEEQLADLYNPIAPLPSGGYLVINPTEALISIDVNSGRSTTERNVEETAFKTNLEAAEEVARQLRLRDLGGLVVIDFIDMGYGKHRRAVERALKDALKSDRAKVQVGHISAFGLLELSRQRLGPSIFETTTQPCSHCGGTGNVRSPDATAVSLIRELESMAFDGQSEIRVRMTAPDALCLLNRYRHEVARLEQAYGLKLTFETDDSLIEGIYAFGNAPAGGERGKDRRPQPPRRRSKRGGRNGKMTRGLYKSDDPEDEVVVEEELLDSDANESEGSEGESFDAESGDERGERGRRRRGRRGGRGRGRRDEHGDAPYAEDDKLDAETTNADFTSEGDADEAQEGLDQEDERGERGRRRRGRRGGRGRGRREDMPARTDGDNASSAEDSDVPQYHETGQRPAREVIAYAEPETTPAHPAERARSATSTTTASSVVSEPVSAPRPTAPARQDTPVDENQPKRKGWWSKITG
jgi:ribonuclease E